MTKTDTAEATSETPTNSIAAVPNSDARRGRKSYAITWPDGSFSVDDLLNRLSVKMSRVTVQNKINTAINEKHLRENGESEAVSGAVGRRRRLYAKV